jgi:hypothetical protein
VPLIRHRTARWDATTTDDHPLALAQRGDREAFAALYDRYLARIHGHSCRLLGGREAAEMDDARFLGDLRRY